MDGVVSTHESQAIAEEHYKYTGGVLQRRCYGLQCWGRTTPNEQQQQIRRREREAEIIDLRKRTTYAWAHFPSGNKHVISPTTKCCRSLAKYKKKSSDVQLMYAVTCNMAYYA